MPCEMWWGVFAWSGKARRVGGGCVLCQLDEGNGGIGQQAINDGGMNMHRVRVSGVGCVRFGLGLYGVGSSGDWVIRLVHDLVVSSRLVSAFAWIASHRRLIAAAAADGRQLHL